ncbi:AsmA-like C-terminal region-containing protein [Devosia aurantiaca]|uniref:AsmA-like C-terminal region-containing protein n=1 Tax=Devosia aurantiaca TaxID=2714858 RepID=A0A6M1SLN9_9HYPH|nr:AsmA-like C-terminal region-containing protein [Devosia aurantiaca]NGP18030.1 AsmA-like C-terminal region-containing protein [Devosia aurantiaca]
MRIGFGDEPRFDGKATLGTLSATQTAALQALLPNVADTSFGHSFPHGSVSLVADSVDVLGLPAVDLVADAQWSPETFSFSQLNVAGWGGLSVDGKASIAGALNAPRITGSGDIDVLEADSPALELIYEAAGLPFEWQQGLAGAWPAALQFVLSDGDTGAAQVLTLSGTLGEGDFDLRAEMADGLPALTTGDLRLVASLEGQADAVQSQFGFADRVLFDGPEPLVASLFVDGSATEGFEGRVALSQGGQSLSYFGDLAVAADGQISGAGTLEAQLDAGNGLAALAGAAGASLGAVDASAALRFDGTTSVVLDNISAVVGNEGVRGTLTLGRTGEMPSWSGSLETDALDAGGLAAAFFGTEALLGVAPETGPWPEGPLAADTEQRSSRGDVSINAGKVTANGVDVFGPTEFSYGWDADAINLRNLQADIGAGTLAMNVTLCCSGPLTDRTLSGRVTLAGVDLDALTPGPLASGLAGLVDGGLQFEGTGASLADVMRAMTGEGNFSVADFAATGLSPSVFPTVAAIDDPLNTDADTLETLTGLGLSQGDFTADLAQGAFTIAGGTARLANLIIEGQGGALRAA